MYLFIFEDGSVLQTDRMSDEDKNAIHDGILEVIDISNGDKPVSFYNDKWHDVEMYSND
jgi:hypothetical protein